MTPLARLLAAALLLAAAPLQARAQEQAPAVVVNAVELSGDGAIAGNNFNNGVRLAFKEINAAGGILGRQVEVVPLDIQTKPEVAKAALWKATDLQAFAVMGPVFSDMVLATMEEIRRAGRPTFVGAEAANVTEQGNPYVFRTSLSQGASMPRLARYLKDGLRVESVAMVWVDNAFGRGGHEAMAKALAKNGIEVVADLMTAPEQRDFADVATKVRASGANAAFVYLNEREAADCLRALFDEAYGGWVVGETTLAGQSVIEMAGAAASGVQAHVGLTPDALVPG
ncbi:MAG TPA: ABC transporter substrate-binding protein, partial [Geminicoccaceae bacterium]|nr:ABC transporter substrate-binding protein [Geminicoccaceae bacterium]